MHGVTLAAAVNRHSHHSMISVTHHRLHKTHCILGTPLRQHTPHQNHGLVQGTLSAVRVWKPSQ